MKARIRISTSPPSEYNFPEDDASYYCDILENENWASFSIVASQADALKDRLKKHGLIGYVVRGALDKELGVVICYEDDIEDLMYCGIDYFGNARCEPAVNEALWHVANAGISLPNGCRIER